MENQATFQGSRNPQKVRRIVAACAVALSVGGVSAYTAATHAASGAPAAPVTASKPSTPSVNEARFLRHLQEINSDGGAAPSNAVSARKLVKAF